MKSNVFAQPLRGVVKNKSNNFRAKNTNLMNSVWKVHKKSHFIQREINVLQTFEFWLENSSLFFVIFKHCKRHLTIFCTYGRAAYCKASIQVCTYVQKCESKKIGFETTFLFLLLDLVRQRGFDFVLMDDIEESRYSTLCLCD